MIYVLCTFALLRDSLYFIHTIFLINSMTNPFYVVLFFLCISKRSKVKRYILLIETVSWKSKLFIRIIKLFDLYLVLICLISHENLQLFYSWNIDFILKVEIIHTAISLLIKQFVIKRIFAWNTLPNPLHIHVFIYKIDNFFTLENIFLLRYC